MKNKEKPVKTTKVNIRLTENERETVVMFNESDSMWTVESSIKRHITKLRKAGWDEVSRCIYENGDECAVTFQAPEFALTFRKPVRRKLTEEQKAAFVERMRKTSEGAE